MTGVTNHITVNSINIDTISQIAKNAGEEILRIYHDANFSKVVDFKNDNSPLTLADKAAHDVITNELEKAYPGIPIISEEGEEIAYEKRKHWPVFWLVDPLDGTKEFINRNGEFTVNIALIEHKKPVLGVIFVPVKNALYEGKVNFGARKIENGRETKLKVSHRQKQRTAVRSKSHASVEEEAVLKKYDVVDGIAVGSSLKFCMVAEGNADIYYRHGPTMEWDTAAGQAIVEAAGGQVFKNTGKELFSYNKRSLLNSSFLCLG